MKDIRNKEISEMASICTERLDKISEEFNSGNCGLSYSRNKKAVKHYLARITFFIDQETGINSEYLSYLRSRGPKPYEIEHIISDKFERYSDEFIDQYEFKEWRDKIGGLILIPKGFNQSYGDSTYEEKVKHYYGQNSLAKSLATQCYKKNPSFLNFIKEKNLPFKPLDSFGKAEIKYRIELFSEMSKEIWDVDFSSLK